MNVMDLILRQLNGVAAETCTRLPLYKVREDWLRSTLFCETEKAPPLGRSAKEL
jgi:hypothetical protein